MTEDEARGVLLSFEHATEGAHHGHPDFRVNNKIFATLWPGKGRSVLRLSAELAEGLSSSESDKYQVVSRSGKWSWLNVQLSAVEPSEYSAIASAAYRNVL